jgi:hypothetical protein
MIINSLPKQIKTIINNEQTHIFHYNFLAVGSKICFSYTKAPAYSKIKSFTIRIQIHIKKHGLEEMRRISETVLIG